MDIKISQNNYETLIKSLNIARAVAKFNYNDELLESIDETKKHLKESVKGVFPDID